MRLTYLGLELFVWAKPSTCTSKSVRKEWVLVPLSCGKTQPTPSASAPRSTGWQARGGFCRPGHRPRAGAVSFKSLRVHSVARIGPPAKSFRQQEYFSNFMFVGRSSKLGYTVPSSSGLLKITKTTMWYHRKKNTPTAPKYFSLQEEIILCKETFPLCVGLTLSFFYIPMLIILLSIKN